MLFHYYVAMTPPLVGNDDGVRIALTDLEFLLLCFALLFFVGLISPLPKITLLSFSMSVQGAVFPFE